MSDKKVSGEVSDHAKIEQKATYSQISKRKHESDSDDSHEDLHRGPGAPYPPDSESDDDEDIELSKWMGPVKLEFPPKVLIGGIFFSIISARSC